MLYGTLERLGSMRIHTERRCINLRIRFSILMFVFLLMLWLVLQSIWQRSLKEVIAFLKNGSLDSFAPYCINYEFIVSCCVAVIGCINLSISLISIRYLMCHAEILNGLTINLLLWWCLIAFSPLTTTIFHLKRYCQTCWVRVYF